MAANDDDWIANVLSYARYQFGNTAKNKNAPSPVVTSKEVKALRKINAARNKAWTLDELKNIKE